MTYTNLKFNNEQQPHSSSTPPDEQELETRRTSGIFFSYHYFTINNFYRNYVATTLHHHRQIQHQTKGASRHDGTKISLFLPVATPRDGLGHWWEILHIVSAFVLQALMNDRGCITVTPRRTLMNDGENPSHYCLFLDLPCKQVSPV